MKKVISLFAVLMAAAVWAEDAAPTEQPVAECSNTYGIMKIASTSKKTIVAVPWCACSTKDNQPIAVSNIIHTANLTAGDTIHVLNKDTQLFNTWELQEGAGGVLYWQTVNQVGPGGEASASPTPDNAGIARGDALVVIRSGTPTEGERDLTQPFYVVGQVGTGDVERVITQGTSDAPCYNLVSSPADHSVDLLAALTNPADGDLIQVVGTSGSPITYTYYSSSSKWGRKAGRTADYRVANTDSTLMTTPGIGFWYVSKTSAENPPKFAWVESVKGN